MVELFKSLLSWLRGGDKQKAAKDLLDGDVGKEPLPPEGTVVESVYDFKTNTTELLVRGIYHADATVEEKRSLREQMLADLELELEILEVTVPLSEAVWDVEEFPAGATIVTARLNVGVIE